MRKYDVVVKEAGMSMHFEGLEAANKNKACAEAISQYCELMSETAITDLVAVAHLSRG